jgi:hypothetical protein
MTRLIRLCEGTAQIGSRIDVTIGRAMGINSMWRILCFASTASCLARELSMAAVVVLIALAWIAIDFLEIGARVRVRRGQASLAKILPPDVQADMKPKLLHLVTVLTFAAVIFLMIKVDLCTTSRMGTEMILVAGGLIVTVASAARTSWMTRTRLDRGYLGEVLVDLSPYPLAGAIRLRFGLLFVMYFLALFGMIGISFAGFQRAGGLLFLTVWAAIALLILWMYLKYVDRIWLTERGLCFGGRFYPWDGFERVAWADNGEAFALRRRGLWRLQRWTVVPVHNWSREAAEEALRQVMPAST